MDHVIYRDYIVNRCFFIYCSLACSGSDVRRSKKKQKTKKTDNNNK